MKKLVKYSACIALVFAYGLLAAPAFAQPSYEVGVLGGASGYFPVDVMNAGTGSSGEVGSEIGYGGGFVLGQNMGDHWGGELRYLFLKNDYELDAGSQTVNFTGQSHTVHYDVLFYFSDRDSGVRPYLAGGGGVRNYRGTGTERPDQRFTDLVIFTKASETELVGDFGLGVKFRIGDNGLFRLEFRDYVTNIPKDVITPGPGSDLDGVIHNWAPLFGFSWTW